MPGFGNIVQKAFYLGVGLASYASEKAGGTLGELRVQAQKLADELVERGEMTTEEARKLVDDLMQQAQQQPVNPPLIAPHLNRAGLRFSLKMKRQRLLMLRM
jgi:hypothetical protein